MSSLGAAADEAAKLGADAISNSYGTSEFSGETAYDSYFDHPGIMVTVSSGDGSRGFDYPAASPYVTAVGGTSLTKSSSSPKGWTETPWSGAGSGCSAYEPKPSWGRPAPVAATGTWPTCRLTQTPTGRQVLHQHGGLLPAQQFLQPLVEMMAALLADGHDSLLGSSGQGENSPVLRGVSPVCAPPETSMPGVGARPHSWQETRRDQDRPGRSSLDSRCRCGRSGRLPAPGSHPSPSDHPTPCSSVAVRS